MSEKIFIWAILGAMYILYNLLIFTLVDKILEYPRFNVLYRIPIMAFNTVVCTVMTLFKSSSSATAYILSFIIIFASLFICYKTSLDRIVFLSLVCILHSMTIRSICAGLISIATGMTIFQVANDPVYLTFSILLMLTINNLLILFAIRFVPESKLKVINQNAMQRKFMIGWLGVFTVFLILNAEVYNIEDFGQLLNRNQILLSLAILIGTNLLMLYNVKTEELFSYKLKSEELENEIINEKQLLSSMVSNAYATYEINLTRNIALSGFSEYRDESGNLPYSYSEILTIFEKKNIYHEDLPEFLRVCSIENTLSEYKKGVREIKIEYRRYSRGQKLIWMVAIINLMSDSLTGDVKAFIQTKNIDEEKRLKLELLQKAEHDALTRLYNRGTTENRIQAHLKSQGDFALSALFIIDIDNFKCINDYFGHTFGDVVLCELAEKLLGIFRGDDIVGRIGGDEFIAFIKNIRDLDIVKAKAEEICKEFQITYKSEENAIHSISASIGIAVCPINGRTFEVLYKNADIALYLSKSKGKNTFSIYDGEGFSGYSSNRTEIDNLSDLPQKSFKENRIEYVFKILFDANNSLTAIRAVLELISKHFDYSRGFIFEIDEDNRSASNTFEWCAEKIEPQISELQNVSLDLIEEFIKLIKNRGIVVLKDLEGLSDYEKEALTAQNIKSMLLFGIFEGGQLSGFIGFDDCVGFHGVSELELDEIATISNILATFLLRTRANERAKRSEDSTRAIIDLLGGYVYVVNRNTYELLFLSDKTMKAVGGIKKMDLCYKVFKDRDDPCPNCEIHKLSDDTIKTVDFSIYSDRLKAWTNVTGQNIAWQDVDDACLITCRESEPHIQ